MPVPTTHEGLIQKVKEYLATNPDCLMFVHAKGNHVNVSVGGDVSDIAEMLAFLLFDLEIEFREDFDAIMLIARIRLDQLRNEKAAKKVTDDFLTKEGVKK
jgi:hypothetical protein